MKGAGLAILLLLLAIAITFSNGTCGYGNHCGPAAPVQQPAGKPTCVPSPNFTVNMPTC